MIVDAHVHVFRRADALPRVVDDLVPPEREAPVEDLLTVMASAGVERAVLVPLDTEDAYVAQVLREHPGRFAAIAVAGAPEQGRVPGVDPLAALRRRREGLEFHGLRTQWLGRPEAPLAESPMLPVLRHLAEQRLVLWSYPSRDQMGLLEQLPETVPGLEVVLNHLGFCPHDMQVDRHGRPAFADPFPPGSVEVVERLARHPSTFAMFSGQYALSGEPPPYRDLDEVVRRVAAAFGPERMLWASDYPWTRDVPGHRTLLGLAAETLPGLSAGELAAIHGGTALGLFPDLRPSEHA